jgi:glycerol uptake operon antiterminator
MDLRERLAKHPIIPALRDLSSLDEALSFHPPVMMLLTGDIFDLHRVISHSREHNTITLVHLDLIDGVGRDKVGLRYLRDTLGLEGVVSTRSNLLKDARALGLVTILRLFVLDSAAYHTGIGLLHSLGPDAVEVLPGVVVPHLAAELAQDVAQPLIASGIIRNETDIRAVLAAGATAVTTSQRNLWGLKLHS